jgi:cytosine/adenosine deaminase-related metal-dependent hydrolase
MMKNLLLVPDVIVTADSDDRILKSYAIEISGQNIVRIIPVDSDEYNNFKGEVIPLRGKVITPGFIQTHIHLCQTLFRGIADDMELLDWLQQRIFPCENAHDPDSLRTSVKLGLFELTRGGTTTILDMGTMRHQETVFDELINSGVRAVAGKCMIDENDLYPDFRSSTAHELKYTYELAQSYHNFDNGRIRYGFAPRFALSCTEKLLKETKAMMKDFSGSIYHTHSSENKNEIQEVRRRSGKENIDYFNSIGALADTTVLAHCVHVNEKEIGLLKSTGTRVAHCPSSNMKLASGIAPIQRYLTEGISVSLGADGAPCNNTLSVFNEMRLAALLQKPFHGPRVLDAKTIFKLATIEGARALHLDDITGSIETGKKADLCALDLRSPRFSVWKDSNALYSNIVYSATANDVADVMINGKWAVRNGASSLYDERQLRNEAETQLKKVLLRAKI